MLSAALTALLLPAPILPAPPTLLQQAREALTVSAPTWKEAKLTGKAQYYGVEHEYTFLFKPDGSFVQSFKGPISESFGSDGKNFWEMDRSRAVERLDFEDRDQVLAMALVMTSNWINPKSPVSVTEEGGKLKLKLSTSGQVETISIDPVTGLPTEMTLPVSAGLLSLKMSDWRAAGDRKIPMHLEVTEGGLTDTITADKLESGDDETSPFAVPDWKPTDVTFDPAKPATAESKRAISGHILVHPLVNGQDVGWFILDSGAEVTVMDKKTADTMKLASIGREPLTGVGGTVESSFRPIDSITLGPATVKNLLVSDFDLGGIGDALGVKLVGVLGSDFFRRTIVSVDLKTASVEIHSRDGFQLDSGSWLPVRFSSGNPAIEATADGAPKAWFRFDTGAQGTLTFHGPFVKKWNLLEGKKTVPVGSGGVGGMVTTQMGKIKWFELAGHRFENPTVMFSTGSDGAFNEPYLAGNIGQDFMLPFRVVLDFSGYRIALIPR